MEFHPWKNSMHLHVRSQFFISIWIWYPSSSFSFESPENCVRMELKQFPCLFRDLTNCFSLTLIWCAYERQRLIVITLAVRTWRLVHSDQCFLGQCWILGIPICWPNNKIDQFQVNTDEPLNDVVAFKDKFGRRGTILVYHLGAIPNRYRNKFIVRVRFLDLTDCSFDKQRSWTWSSSSDWLNNWGSRETSF